MSVNAISERERVEMTGKSCTLNGQPAKICGTGNHFASIATLDPLGPRVEFCWTTIMLTMTEKNGKFRS